jgi:hypothetical protein
MHERKIQTENGGSKFQMIKASVGSFDLAFLIIHFPLLDSCLSSLYYSNNTLIGETNISMPQVVFLYLFLIMFSDLSCILLQSLLYSSSLFLCFFSSSWGRVSFAHHLLFHKEVQSQSSEKATPKPG